MSYIVELLKYILLGVIQGITEIFPVSSSGHLVLFSTLLMNGQDIESELKLLLMITNMGSFIALFIFYFKDIKDLIIDSFDFIFKKEKRVNSVKKENFFYALKLCIAVIPIGITGLIANKYLTPNLLFTGISLIVTSILLFTVFMLRNKQFINDITWKNATVIGLFQALAPLPGLSRSGITIVGGLSQKVELKKVLRFSFLAYILVSVPVSLLGLYEAIKNPGVIDIPGFVLAFIFSFLFSLLTVRVMNKYVQVKNLIWFSIYAFIVGTLSITLYLFI
ncbi:undecaprenyl-diphosphate phosphatase [Acholeplasma hippikon]|uniref:Undecaprenyl-diphosphatase n=1 Tax=Acholeplasma hippikon TaxID=264636 RepID=A0A449BJI3_9MOLU|nr:undecaprenyl-diphosphate phosphatase [Acholeplasma hippikon]VEU82624.1 Undecaprenyl-diphosphatase [Acholeplasma hippikon]